MSTLRTFLCMLSIVLLTACGNSEPEAADETANQTPPPAEETVEPEAAEEVADANANIDVCAEVPADVVAEVLEVDAATVDASADHLRLMGDFLGSCGYKVGDMLRASYTVAPDEDGYFARMEQQATPEGIVRPAEPVAGYAAVSRMDGSLIWNQNSALHTIQVMDASGAPDSSGELHRRLAERIAAD